AAFAPAMTAPHPAVLDYPFAAPPPAGETLELAPGVLWRRLPRPFPVHHINLWLLPERGAFALVDCGYGDAPTRALWERHFAGTMKAAGLAQIVATHYHPDHLGTGAWLMTRFGCA